MLLALLLWDSLSSHSIFLKYWKWKFNLQWLWQQKMHFMVDLQKLQRKLCWNMPLCCILLLNIWTKLFKTLCYMNDLDPIQRRTHWQVVSDTSVFTDGSSDVKKVNKQGNIFFYRKRASSCSVKGEINIEVKLFANSKIYFDGCKTSTVLDHINISALDGRTKSEFYNDTCTFDYHSCHIEMIHICNKIW